MRQARHRISLSIASDRFRSARAVNLEQRHECGAPSSRADGRTQSSIK
jgi:hypothetical protein